MYLSNNWFHTLYHLLYLIKEGSGDNLLLLLSSKLNKVDSITRNTNCKLWILLRMIHGINQYFSIQNININMMSISHTSSVNEAARNALSIFVLSKFLRRIIISGNGLPP